MVYSRYGVVASEEPHASIIGANILGKGGNAVDAAVATSMALAVTVPHLGGIGGDFFALVREPSGETWFINGSGAAPRRLTRSLLLQQGYSVVPRGPLSPTVPGMVDGLYAMWRRGGSLEWRSLILPAARLASQGFPASFSLAHAVEKAHSLLAGDRGSAETYLREPPIEGRIFRLKGLAKLLKMVAEDPRVFYKDEPAERIEEYVAEHGGVLAADDLRSHDSFEDRPLSSMYREWRLWETPPNTQGASTLQLLMMMEEEEIPRVPSSPERTKLLLRLAPPLYEWRNLHLGDPGAMSLSYEQLVDPGIVKEIRKLRYTGCRGGGMEGDTTFFAVADKEGRLVAGIQSLFHHFGSLLTEPSYQVTLNDRALGFTLEQGRPSTLEPGRRPLHTLSALLMEGPEDTYIALGASAGHLRPQLYAWLASNIVDYGMKLSEAVSHSRVAWDPETCMLLAERDAGIPLGYPAILKERLGVASIAALLGGIAIGVADERGAGIPVPAYRCYEPGT